MLRCELGLTGTKFGCGISVCGACTVLVRKPGEKEGLTTACHELVRDLHCAQVTTIEGLQGGIADALRKAWLECDVVQCGYCQSAQLIAAKALLTAHPAPDDGQIDDAMMHIACRCGTFPRIRKAIHRAVEILGGRPQHDRSPDVPCRKDSGAPS